MMIMQPINLATVDLNLLTVLNMLLAERHVTRAARRLGLTQPAVSHALGRLRQQFADPLLVRVPGGMRPTPRALELAPAIEDILQRIAATLGSGGAFTPASTTRQFSLGMSDYAAFLLAPGLLTRLRTEAPGSSLVIRHASRALAAGMLESGEVELAVGYFPNPPGGLPAEDILRDRLVVAMRADHPMLRRRFGLPAFLAAAHVNVSLRGEAGGSVDQALEQAGHKRRIVATLGHFLVLPEVLAATDLVATEPGRVIRHFAGALPLATRKPPFAAPDFVLTQMWHRRHGDDPAHGWLRRLVAAIAGAL